MSPILALLSLLILFLFLGALFLFFVNQGYALSEAGVYAIVVSMAVYAAVFQLFFLLGAPHASFVLDGILAGWAAGYLVKFSTRLADSVVQALAFFRRFRRISVPFGLIFAYLLAQALTVPPSEYDSLIHNLPRILLMMQEESLFLKNYSTFNQVGFFVGADLLQFLFLRWHSDWFLGTFSFLSYVAVLLATFSLVRAHLGDEKLALVTALVVGSLVELALQSTSTKNDIPLTAMAAATFLAAAHVLSRRDPLSLALLCIALALGSSMKAYFLGFSLPFAVLFLAVFFREVRTLAAASLKTSWCWFLLPVLLLAQLSLFLGVNYSAHGSVFGSPANVQAHRNPDGWRGALANASRYMLQTAGLPRQLGGDWLEKLHGQAWDPYRDAGKAPLAFRVGDPQDLSLSLFQPPIESVSGYGPLAFFLCFPALVYSLVRGPTFIRLTAASLWLFFAALCWQVGWMPWNNRFLSLFFGGSGLCVGYFLQRVAARKYDAVWLLLSFLFLSYATFLNHFKPFIDLRQAGLWVHRHLVQLQEMEGKGEGDRRYYKYPVFTWVNVVVERDAYWRRYYRDERVAVVTRALKPRARLLWVAGEYDWIFPYLLKRPDLRVTLTTPERLNDLGLGFLWHPGEPSLLAQHFDYVLVGNVPPPPFLDPGRLVFRGERWYDEHGVPQGEAVALYDYTGATPASQP